MADPHLPQIFATSLNIGGIAMSGLLEELVQYLRASKSILVVVGAGLSQSSGLPTFREDPEFWGRPIQQIASRNAFNEDPATVWGLYEHLRQLAINAVPNEGHVALAHLSQAKPSCLTVTQNIDGYEAGMLQALHGSVLDVRCAGDGCDYRGRNVDRQISGLIWCPACKSTYLRPGVVWFGERLPPIVVEQTEAWLESHDCIDMVLVFGTDRTPYVCDALAKSAKMAWFNIMEDDWDGATGDADWVVNGDAARTLPAIIYKALAGEH
ncbi:hypothetical protein LTR49_026603 [Elasticomyces elasticus]|nr:hypothetical protein LTR49_026603 [Elasticomyces elasticus]